MFEKEYCVVRKIMFVTHRNVAAGAVFEFKCFVAKVLNQLRRSIVWAAQALCGKKKIAQNEIVVIAWIVKLLCAVSKVVLLLRY